MTTEEKENYENLTDRQKAFVDAVAELKGRGMDVTLERVSEGMQKQDEEPYERSHFYRAQKLFDTIIEERKQLVANERNDFQGDEHVTAGEDGRPEIDATMKHFSEMREEQKNEKIEQEVSDSSESSETFQVELSRRLAFKLIHTADDGPAYELFLRLSEEINKE